MARKDFEEYYTKAYKQYKSMNETLKRVSEDVANNMTDFSFVEKLKEQIAPIKKNYETLTWIKYLLDRPNRKEKKKKFDKVEPYKSLDKKFSQEEIQKANEYILNELDKRFNK